MTTIVESSTDEPVQEEVEPASVEEDPETAPANNVNAHQRASSIPDPGPPLEPPRPAPAAAPAPPVSTPYYKNCTAVWNAIERPITIGDPGYASHHDSDSCGIGSENDPRNLRKR